VSLRQRATCRSVQKERSPRIICLYRHYGPQSSQDATASVSRRSGPLPKDIIVIGASAGGIEALRTLVAGLPHDFSASVFIVLHTSPEWPGILDKILSKAGPLPALIARDGERIMPGRIYVARSDHHLIIEPGIVRVSRGPKENRFRPAIDPLFRSAAQTYGPRVIGVVLTGGMDDGTAGLWAIKKLGGTAIVQDPEDALVPSMPISALAHVDVDYCVPVVEIPNLLVKLTGEPSREGAYDVPEEIEIEVRIAKEGIGLASGVLRLGEPSNYTCPECHGVLLQVREENRTRFRCHTGHAFSVDNLMAAVSDGVEEALWNAIRQIEEKILLMRHLATHVGQNGGESEQERYLKRADEAQRQVNLVREAVLHQNETHEVPVAIVQE
jgi:two-component system, chemotaxis family, protein-glutamate methylesterase/glutaminase